MSTGGLVLPDVSPCTKPTKKPSHIHVTYGKDSEDVLSRYLAEIFRMSPNTDLSIPFQGVDVVATFPSSASESSVLWFKSKMESVPGLVVTTRPISSMEKKKTKQCYAFQITATYQG